MKIRLDVQGTSLTATLDDYSSGLVKLGRLDAGADVLRRSGPLTTTIERI